MNSNVSHSEMRVPPHDEQTGNVAIVARATGRMGNARIVCANDSDTELIFRISIERDADPPR